MTRVRFAPSARTHRHRVQRAVGRLASESPSGAAGAPAALAGLSVDGRWLAGVAAFGDRDGARALALIGDESRRVRGVALSVAALACDDAQATEALRVAWSVRGERRLLRRMCKHGRTAAIDAFLDGLAAEGHLRDLVDDLPFGSEACVRRHLAHALERPSQRFWDGLSLAHPELLAELLRARWEANPGEADPVTRQLTDRHHLRLAERAPDAALALAELLLARTIYPAQRVWMELLRRRPEATVALALGDRGWIPAGVFEPRLPDLSPELLARIIANVPHLLGGFGPRVRKLSADRQRALAEAWCDASERFPAHGAYLLKYLAPDERREQAYRRWSLAARDADGVIAAELIAALPIELAASEARRHVREVTALQVDPVRRLQGRARYMPWAELQPALRDQLGHPEGSMRSLALTELLANPGVYPDDPDLPARALELVVARRFEQDPVRFAMMSALALWPRRVWRPEHLPGDRAGGARRPRRGGSIGGDRGRGRAAGGAAVRGRQRVGGDVARDADQGARHDPRSEPGSEAVGRRHPAGGAAAARDRERLGEPRARAMARRVRERPRVAAGPHRGARRAAGAGANRNAARVDRDSSSARCSRATIPSATRPSCPLPSSTCASAAGTPRSST